MNIELSMFWFIFNLLIQYIAKTIDNRIQSAADSLSAEKAVHGNAIADHADEQLERRGGSDTEFESAHSVDKRPVSKIIVL